MTQLALAWCLAQEGPSCVLTGPRSTDHLTECLSAGELELDGEDLATLDEVSPPGRAVIPFYRGYGRAPNTHHW